MNDDIHRRGDLPKMCVPPPGPIARRLSRSLADLEAPGINTIANEPNILWREASGATVTDVDGNRYLDLTSGFGVAAVGHRHPRVVAAVSRQSETLIHGLGDAAAHPLRIRLAQRLRALAPFDEAQTYFSVSGADAVEIALKTAALHTGRSTLLAFDPSYHGLTLGALAATSRPAFRRPFEMYLHDHLVRLPFGAPIPDIDYALRNRSIAAVLVEPIVGREGVLIPPPGWLRQVSATCRDHGTLLIVDEIFTGAGRTGRFFAVENEDTCPDLLCCGKAIGGGLPFGAVLAPRSIMAAWQAPGEARHTATFVAHPLACAAALETLDIIEHEDLVGRTSARHVALAQRLAIWPERSDSVVAVRGRGLLWGVELSDAPAARTLVQACRSRGVLLLAGGPEGRVVQLVPPLIITDRQLDHALGIIEQSLTAKHLP